MRSQRHGVRTGNVAAAVVLCGCVGEVAGGASELALAPEIGGLALRPRSSLPALKARGLPPSARPAPVGFRGAVASRT